MGERNHAYDKVVFNQTRYDLLTEDDDVAFLLECWDGDLIRGLFMVTLIVHPPPPTPSQFTRSIRIVIHDKRPVLTT